MIYISFDIGIKNLALCILERTDEKIQVLDWRIITLADKKKTSAVLMIYLSVYILSLIM